jgi:hypothetical protein
VPEYFANLVYNEWAKNEKQRKIEEQKRKMEEQMEEKKRKMEEQKHVLNLFHTKWSGTGHEAASGKMPHDADEEAASPNAKKEEEEKYEDIYFEMKNKSDEDEV